MARCSLYYSKYLNCLSSCYSCVIAQSAKVKIIQPIKNLKDFILSDKAMKQVINSNLLFPPSGDAILFQARLCQNMHECFSGRIFVNSS